MNIDVRQGEFAGKLDRKQVPPVKDFESVSLPKPETTVLANGIPVYILYFRLAGIMKRKLCQL